MYLIGHGYAPVFKVTDSRGQVVYDQATPFISGASGNFLSQGVVKVPGAQPEQLGFTGVFVPTAVEVGGVLESAFPAADNPVVSLIAYAGNLGLNDGVPQSVYQMNTAGMHQLTSAPQLLRARPVAQAAGRPGHDHVHRVRPVGEPGHHPRPRPAARPDLRPGRPGRPAALVHGAAQASLRPGPRERSPARTVQIGGLARTDASGGFEAEFASLAAELRSAHSQHEGE